MNPRVRLALALLGTGLLASLPTYSAAPSASQQLAAAVADRGDLTPTAPAMPIASRPR
jgi:hypothetical protein